MPELGFSWRLAVLDPLPRSSRFAFVPARLRHVFVYVLGLVSSPLGVSKVPLRQLVHDRFLPCLSSDLGGVSPFRIHCPEAPVLRLSRLCCVTFFVYVLGLSSSPLGVSKVPLRQLVHDRFLPCPSSDLKWRLAVSDPLPRGSRFAFVPARLRHVFCLRPGALFFSFKGSKGATSAAREGPFFAVPELGFSWRSAVSDPLPRGSRFAFVPARLRHVLCLRTGALFFSFRGSKGATSAACERPTQSQPRISCMMMMCRLRLFSSARSVTVSLESAGHFTWGVGGMGGSP